MQGYMTAQGQYYMGDRQGDDVIVPVRPSPGHTWDGKEWLHTGWDDARLVRAPLLAEADIAFARAQDQNTDLAPFKKYRQALRDVTKGPDPASPAWPTRPW